jgi:hypothetical protein
VQSNAGDAELIPACYFAVRVTDTSPAAQAVQLRIQQSMSGEQRLLLAFEMSLFARELNRERIRREHPECLEARIVHELLRLAFLPTVAIGTNVLHGQGRCPIRMAVESDVAAYAAESNLPLALRP